MTDEEWFEESREEKIIGYIEKGVVIDHIPVGRVWQIVDLLGISSQKNGRVSLGDGYESHKDGKKGILKVEGKFLTPNQLNLVALVAENARVNLISGGKVKRKIDIKIPPVLEGIVECPNLGCISNNDSEKVVSKVNYDSQSQIFSCHYCSREFEKQDLKFRDY